MCHRPFEAGGTVGKGGGRYTAVVSGRVSEHILLVPLEPEAYFQSLETRGITIPRRRFSWKRGKFDLNFAFPKLSADIFGLERFLIEFVSSTIPYAKEQQSETQTEKKRNWIKYTLLAN